MPNELQNIAGGIENGSVSRKGSLADPSKVKNRIAVRPGNSTPIHIVCLEKPR